MRTPSHIPNGVLEAAADEYIREVRRIRRAQIRASIANSSQAEGSPVLTEDEQEAYVDIVETLVKVADYDGDKINQVIDELAWSPEGKLSSDQILLSLESRLVETAPTITNADLDQYHFEVTGKIFTRCKGCRRGRYWPAQEFILMSNAFLRRALIGGLESCPFCQTGHIKVYGVKAVLRDQTLVSQDSITLPNTEEDLCNKKHPNP